MPGPRSGHLFLRELCRNQAGDRYAARHSNRRMLPRGHRYAVSRIFHTGSEVGGLMTFHTHSDVGGIGSVSEPVVSIQQHAIIPYPSLSKRAERRHQRNVT